MKKTRLLSLVVSLSMILSTSAIFMPTAQAADSKIISVTDILGEEKAANLKAEWIFQGENGTEYKDGTDYATYTSTTGGFKLGRPSTTTDGNKKIVDSNVMGSAVQIWKGGMFQYLKNNYGNEGSTALDRTGKSSSTEVWVCIGTAWGHVVQSDGWDLRANGLDNGTGKLEFKYKKDDSMGISSDTVANLTYPNSNKSQNINENKDWQHIVVVKEVTPEDSENPYKETFRIYINGEQKWSKDFTTKLKEEKVNISNYKDESEYRWYSSVRVFDTALTADDVTALYETQGRAVGLVAGGAGLATLTVNDEELAADPQVKNYETVVAKTTEAASVVATANDPDAKITYELNDEVIVDNANISLNHGENIVTITSTVGEEVQKYTVNIIRLGGVGVSPLRNADFSKLTAATQMEAWYFDQAYAGSVYGTVADTKLSAGDSLILGDDATFKKYFRSASNNAYSATSANDVSTVTDARTWSGYVKARSDGPDWPLVIFGKNNGQDFNAGRATKGWVLTMNKVTADGQKVPDTYRLTIRRGTGTADKHQEWRTTGTFLKSDFDWKYITVTLPEQLSDAPSLYINGVAQELEQVKTGAIITDAAPSDEGVGMQVGFKENTGADSYIANLRAFKECFDADQVYELYKAEAIAAGLMEVPVEVTLESGRDGLTISADLTSGNRGEDTVLLVARYDTDGRLLDFVFDKKDAEDFCEVTLEGFDEEDIIKAFVWDSFATMKPISKVYDNEDIE